MAGLQSVGGIPTRSTVCATLSPRGSGLDDTANIQAAVDACTVGQVVSLNAGTYTIGEGNFVMVSNGITVRGAGACAGTALGLSPYPSTAQSACTLIQRTNGVVIQVGGDQNGSNPSPHFVLGATDKYGNAYIDAGTNLTADGAQGAYTVNVASTAGFSAGQFVLVDETSGLGWRATWIWPTETLWSSADYRLNWRAQNPTCISGDQVCAGGSTPPPIPCYFPFGGGSGSAHPDCDMYTKEIKQIASVGANTITFDSPLTISYRTSWSAKVAHIYGGTSGATPFATYVGLENMTLQNADDSEVKISGCAYCWIKNVEVTVGSNNMIAISGGFRDQVEGSLVWKGSYPYPGGAGYNVALDLGSSEFLFQDSISMLNDKVMVARGSGAGSVIAYSYFDESILGGYPMLNESSLGASHWIGSHHVLFEGNWTNRSSSDPVWGPSTFMAWFRNDITGYRTRFYDYVDATTTDDKANIPGPNYNDSIAVYTAIFGYWTSFIGNVLGTPGAMSGWSYYSPNNVNVIWSAGEMDGDNSHIDYEVWTQQAGATAALCTTTGGDQCPMIRMSNYDYVTNSLADSTNPSLPNSFYLSSKPAFFGSYTWPWVNAQGTTKVQSGPTTSACTTNVGGPCSGLPAKARMDNGTPFVQP